MAHPELRQEQDHVDHAYQRLDDLRAAAATRLADALGERDRAFQALTERDIRVRNSLSRIEQLQIGGESLIFGRIDRAADAPPDGAEGTNGASFAPEGPGEAFHVGRLAISDVDQSPLVVDWRAPVAEPFYRATGAHPMSLRRRRHFLTEGRRVVDLEDELFDEEGSDQGLGLGLSGPQSLFAVLDRSRTGRMRDIVATVQREQDEIIRSPLSGVLIVQGGPGTGKTAVALHRAAYLLYTHRFPLETQGVLVVGPNPTFLRYIEQVLPSLGESGVGLSTITGLYADARATGTEDQATARLKGDPRMARVLARAVGDRQRPLRREVSVPFGRAVLRLTPAQSAQIVTAAKRRSGTHNARRRLVESLLWRHLHTEAERRLARRASEVEGEELPTPAELGRDVRRQPEVAEALERMWPVLTPEQLLHDLFGAAPLVQLAAAGVLPAGEYPRLIRRRSVDPGSVAWTESDIPLLDEAAALLGPVPRRTSASAVAPAEADAVRAFGHIVVDEAQDLSPMQLRMLGRRSLSRSMTVVGDIAQATGGWAPTDWGQVVGHLRAERSWRRAELTVNYRTPAEIMSVAAEVLATAEPGMRPPDAVRAGGEAPRVVRADGDLAAATVGAVGAELAELTGGGSVAVVTAPSTREALATALVEAGVPLGGVDAPLLDRSVSLLSVTEAKGLEFDSVVVVEPAAVVEEAARGLRSLYVALTRSTRRLAVVHDRPLPEALDRALAGSTST